MIGGHRLPQNFRGLKCFALRNFLDPENFLNPKYFWTQIFLTQIFSDCLKLDPVFWAHEMF